MSALMVPAILVPGDSLTALPRQWTMATAQVKSLA